MGVLLLFVSAFGADDPKARDARGNTPLHTAAFRNDAEAVEDLLARGADANATNHARATPLHYGTGSERIVRALLQAGAGVDAVSAAGLTPLLTAVARDRSVEVARQLLESGANANASVPRSDGPYSALTQAILGGDSRTAELLLQYGASVNVPAGRSPLAAAAYVGDAALTQLLLDQIAHINYDSGFAGSALNFAFYSGHPQVASLLIDFGADLTFPSAVGYATPPLLWAAYNETGEAGFARLLLRRRIDLNTINEAGETALSYALKRGPDTPLVRFLREAGAKPPARPAGSKTPPNRIVPAAGPARAALARDGVWMRPSDYDPDGYPITRRLLEEGAGWSILPGPVAITAPVRILQGGADADALTAEFKAGTLDDLYQFVLGTLNLDGKSEAFKSHSQTLSP